MANYTHRNGETRFPTVPGLYWFDGYISPSRVVDAVHVIIDGQVHKARVVRFGVVDDAPSYNTSGEWYGPLVPPWEQAA